MEIFVDALVVGTGAAGLYAALNLKEELKVLLVCKSAMKECNTYLAQGGISVARNEEDEPSFEEDTLKAGKYENNPLAVKTMVQESRENLHRILRFGAQFDRDQDQLKYTREGAHSIHRIVYCKDETGKELYRVLAKEVKSRKNITILENTELIDLLSQNNVCLGGVFLSKDKPITVHSKVTILATGGIGGVFKHSTNQRMLTGDGIAIALKNHIKVRNLEYIQFHPTALYEKSKAGKRFLISESLRGEGAKLFNHKKERFVNELLPRDVVAKAILQEERKYNIPYVSLDVSFMQKDFLKSRFPAIYEKCFEKGIDISKEAIPVSPAQHYHMGGIAIDLDGKTSMKNLFACGEVGCTGVHGANRLASNSLLEALVFSRRSANYINEHIAQIPSTMQRRNPTVEWLYQEREYNHKILQSKFMKMGREITDELVNN